MVLALEILYHCLIFFLGPKKGKTKVKPLLNDVS